MTKIKHIVYLMLEDRSLDQVLGWLYDDQNLPKVNIPAQAVPSYNGLKRVSLIWMHRVINILWLKEQIIT